MYLYNKYLKQILKACDWNLVYKVTENVHIRLTLVKTLQNILTICLSKIPLQTMPVCERGTYLIFFFGVCLCVSVCVYSIVIESSIPYLTKTYSFYF